MCIYLKFIMLVVCNPDVSRVWNRKNNLKKITHHCMSDACAFMWPVLCLEVCKDKLDRPYWS
jgi:hypothetical protein